MTETRIPLLHDNHNHTSLYAALSTCPDISAMDGRQARAFLAGLPSDSLSVVRGWKTNELSVSSEDLAVWPPLLLVNFSLHGFALSDAAMPTVGALFPDIVAHRHDALWLESNVPRLFEAYCELSGLDEARLESFFSGLAKVGIGSAEDMTVASAAALRTMASSRFAGRFDCWAAPGLFESLSNEEKHLCSGIKLFLDGSIGARSAAVDCPWIGGGAPVQTYSDDDLYGVLAKNVGYETGLAMHAIGGLAIEQALRSLARLADDGCRYATVRLEHVQFISRAQAAQAKHLGVILSMQPNFTSDSVDYADRLRPSCLAQNNPFRMLIDEAGFVPGKDLLFGSDGMPHGIAYPATWSLFPPFATQRLSLDELLAGYGPARGITGSTRLAIDEDKRRVTVIS